MLNYTSPYTYDWDDLSGSSNSEDRTGLAAGSYSVTVTDAKGCTISCSSTITQPASALTDTATATDVKCYGELTGAVDLTVSGGTKPYTFSWSN